MKRGDEVWLFCPLKEYDGAKKLERGILVLKKDGIWHVKTKKRFYRRKQTELAVRRPEDKELI